MALTTLLLLVVLGTGTQAVISETTTETTTETATTEMTTTDTTTTMTTTQLTTHSVIITPNLVTFKNISLGNGTFHSTVFPTTGNSTDFQSNSSSAGNATANSTMAPIPGRTATSPTNTTANNISEVFPFGTNTTNSSFIAPPSTADHGTVVPTSSTEGNGSSSTWVVPTRITSVTAQSSTAPRQTPTAVLSSEEQPNPSKAAVLNPTSIQLLLRIPLSFRILNRSFNESLRDPTSKEYQSLQYAVLTMFKRVFGCVTCVGWQSYKGCSELHFSQGSVEVQSTLVFGHSNGTITSNTAEQQLRNSLDSNGFVMDLQLTDIKSAVEVMSPVAAPVVPDWAIALLVLVCILLLLSILSCLLMTTCTCRWKSRGKLDLLSTKDSYHPMAEYAAYQSHGRYVSPNSKPSPYSQVAGSNGAGMGTFTYTNPAAASDNL